MRWLVTSAIVVVCALAGCGGDEGSARQASPGLYTGASSQGLAVSVQADGEGSLVALTWVGRCSGAGYRPATVRLTEETFFFDTLPASRGDRRRVPGDDSDVTTYLRQIDVRADAAAISGSFRIRKRFYNGQGRAVDGLCDSGEVTFSVKPVAATQIPPVTATQDDFREATFEEQIAEALAGLESAINDRDPRAFCERLTVRLKRTFCKGRDATIERMVQQLSFITDAEPARRSGRHAVVVIKTGDATGTTYGVRTLRFSGSLSSSWLLDRVGPRRQVPG